MSLGRNNYLPFRSARSPALTHLTRLVYHVSIAQGAYDKVESSGNGPVLADVLSVLAMTSGKPGERETLKFKLKGGEPDVGSWGHEYVRALAGEQSHFENSVVGSDQWRVITRRYHSTLWKRVGAVVRVFACMCVCMHATRRARPHFTE